MFFSFCIIVNISYSSGFGLLSEQVPVPVVITPLALAIAALSLFPWKQVSHDSFTMYKIFFSLARPKKVWV